MDYINTETQSNGKKFRYYQEDADVAIYEELLINNKCIVKMFCGTGKSLLMRKCKSAQNQRLLVYVFPSLSLIDQFCTDYFIECPFKISSENDSTTDPALIRSELMKPENKVICVTYQSYKTLLDNLGTIKIDVCIYDEAHHAVGETYQKLIFEQEDSVVKQIFFTATPKNANGITMYDRDNLDAGMCGKLVYDYSYLRGMNEGYLNPFEIRVDMYTENTNKSVYESIARAILVSGNNRVLTFHADVNTDRKNSVLNFVNEPDFIRAFLKVLTNEFPEKAGLYKSFKMIALDASIPMKERRTILNKFDTTFDNEVYIISSCETIGEGIDTKNANMCVFVDPKSSFVKIIQNIGRIVRPQSKPSTVLIPCWVDKTKYVGCDKDREKCDEVIRSDLNKDGNFNGILNVLSALRQEDEDIYDICLHYPDTYSPQEIISNLEKHGYKVLDPVGDGELVETMEYLLEQDIDYEDYEDCETNEEMIMRIAEDNDVCVEIHTNSFENQIEKYKSEYESGTTIRLYKEEDDEEGNQVYCPITKKCGKRKGDGSIKGLDRKDRIKIDVHTNPDVKVLWKLVGDFTKEICSCVLECEVVEYDPMEVAIGIVERAKEREKNGENLVPRSIRNIKVRNTPKLEKEYRDYTKLSGWKQALKGKGTCKCSNEVCIYLDKELNGWRTETDYNEKALEDAKAIVFRRNQRPNLIPRQIPDKKQRNTIELEQEDKDATKLSNWKLALKEKGRSKCSNEVRDYLDKELIGWRTDYNEKALEDAKEIVSRRNQRPNLIPRRIDNKQKRNTPELEQEHKDAKKISCLKNGLKGNGSWKCPNEVRDYLDKELVGWRTETDFDEKALEDAKAIVSRKNQRPNLIPRQIYKKIRNTHELEQENEDALRLFRWKKALQGEKNLRCSDEVRDYLDKELVGWRTELDEKSLENAKSIVSRKNQRPNLIPRFLGNKKNRNTPELEQENKDASKLYRWKQALKGEKNLRCSDEVRDYLDEQLKGWRTIEEKSEEEPKEETPVETPKPKKSMKLKEPTKKETPEQRRIRTKSELEVLHQRYKTLTSKNLQKEFQETSELWHQYHTISEENEKSFPEESIPRNRIIQELTQIKGKRTRSVVDMGCGKAQIADHFANDTRFSFINYDHVSSKENVLVQDISKTGLEDNSVEICILCLAMWGSNCHDYVREAYRILESGGKLYIMEATKRWTDDEGGQPADKLKKLLEETGFQIVEQSIEKFCMFICIKI